MTRCSFFLMMAFALLVSGVGCGSQPKKGAEKDRDMPVPADKDK